MSFSTFFVACLWLMAGEARAALEASVSTADSSTADGVVLIGKAVAGFALTGIVVCAVGLLNKPSNADRCCSLIGFGAGRFEA
jgi:hypothetical protein